MRYIGFGALLSLVLILGFLIMPTEGRTTICSGHSSEIVAALHDYRPTADYGQDVAVFRIDVDGRKIYLASDCADLLLARNPEMNDPLTWVSAAPGDILARSESYVDSLVVL